MKDGFFGKLFVGVVGGLIVHLILLHFGLEGNKASELQRATPFQEAGAATRTPQVQSPLIPAQRPEKQSLPAKPADVERPVLRVKVNSNRLQPGQEAEISWDSQNTTRVKVQGDGVDREFGPSAFMKFTPGAGRSRYVVTADGPGGSTSERVDFEALDTGMKFGALAWEGDVDGTDQITINGTSVSAGKIVFGNLPALPCEITSENNSVEPAVNDDCKSLVFRVTGNGHMRVVFRWTKKPAAF